MSGELESSPDRLLSDALKSARLRLMHLEMQMKYEQSQYNLFLVWSLCLVLIMAIGSILTLGFVSSPGATTNTQLSGIVFISIVIYFSVISFRRVYAATIAKKFLEIAIKHLSEVIVEAEIYFRERV